MNNIQANVGDPAPNIQVSEWIQGTPTNIDQEQDHVILIEVFQVNCPGCFAYGMPEAIYIHDRYYDRGVRVLGLATAFEDFDRNTVDNLRLLAESGDVIGETRKALLRSGQLRDGGKLPYSIPFPLAMDQLTATIEEVTRKMIMGFIRQQFPDFKSQPDEIRVNIFQQVKSYFEARKFSAATFETYGLMGTPSTILVDRTGILRDVSFGQSSRLETQILDLL